MTTAKKPKTSSHFRLPDPPERQPDEKMTSAKHLHEPGSTHHQAQHFGNPESNLVAAERYVTMMPERRLPSAMARRYPDLLIALGVDPEAYYESNGYIIGEQVEPPDFVLEVASESTADQDIGPKRTDYEALGIAEYWRFDETGEHHKAKLAVDRLVEGRYEPVAIEELANGVLQGYSAVLNLFICWEHGQLAWHDPATGQHIATFESERERARARARANSAEVRARQGGEARVQAETRADSAEARIRELEEENLRLRGG